MSLSSWCKLRWKHWAAFVWHPDEFEDIQCGGCMWRLYPVLPRPRAVVGMPAEGQCC